MNSRLKGLGFGSKRKSSAVAPTTVPPNTSSPPQPAVGQDPTTASSSTSSLHMNQPGAVGRPPSYTNNYPPATTAAGRTTSPMVPGAPRTPPTQMMGGPPPINTAGSPYPPGHPAAGVMGAPLNGGPPQYGPPQYGTPIPPGGGNLHYPHRNNAVEVEGAGRNKAQLIVGIDFVSYPTPQIQPHRSHSNVDRELPSQVLPLPLRRTQKPRKISSQNGLGPGHTQSRRLLWHI